ncbi:uncharacterized protein ATNIH1004_007551 [Aspergillus tanneri]|uniref:Uncharacterized protein n=1 Tax=Aspergillus tanneri TaxID=1220188 RepID=A0A5M9MGM2_9EURO|nr:uncharacterized protein ATNIH1004_007551 [Aspergillus tanneri]KAA8646125.1 hypothetical protein ATNIH1004_007551 [Aspergillus tanneri]
MFTSEGIGLLTDPGNRRERARRVVTQIDFAAWADSATESKQIEAAGPEPSQDPSSIEPKQREVDLHPISSRTPAGTNSMAQRQNQKILTPHIVARPARTNVTQELPRKAPVAPVTIAFKARGKDGEWRKIHELVVDPSDPTAVERLVRKDERNRGATFYNKNLRMITPAQCYDAAIEDGANTIFVDFEGDLVINEAMTVAGCKPRQPPVGVARAQGD